MKENPPQIAATAPAPGLSRNAEERLQPQPPRGGVPLSNTTTSGWRRWAGIALGVVAYFSSQVLAFHFPDSFGLVAAVWPAAGVALASLLLISRRDWPVLLGCLFVAGLAANLTTDRPAVASVGFMVANICETAAAAWLLTRWCGEIIRFARMRQVLVLIGAATLINAATALIGAGSARLALGAQFWTFYRTWWVADGLGMLLVTPLIVIWARSWGKLGSKRRRRIIEAAVLFVLGSTAAWGIFGAKMVPFSMELHPYMLMVFIIWAALHHGTLSTATLLAALAMIAIGCTVAGLGRFPLGGADIPARLHSVQMFLGVVGGTGLLLAAVVAERKRAEETLTTKEQLYRTLFNMAPCGILLEDTDGNILDANDALCRASGYAHAELVGRNVRLFVPPQESAGLEQDLAALRSGQTLAHEAVNVRKDGSLRIVSLRETPLTLPEGRQSILVAAEDVTESRRAEAVLRESEGRFRLIIEASPVPLAVNDEHGNITFLNRKFMETFGYTLADIPTVAAWWPLASPDPAYRERVAREWSLALARADQTGPNMEAMECKVTCKDGSVRDIRFSVAAMGSSHLVVLYDITESQRAAEALRHSEQSYREIFNATAEAIFLHDAATGRILDVNDSMLTLYGYGSKAEALAGNFRELLLNEAPYTLEEAHRRLGRAIQEGPQVFEWLARKKNGEHFWVEVALRSSQIGGQGRVLAVVRDISERQRMEEALRENAARLSRILEATSGGVWDWAIPTGQAVFSAGYASMLGYSPEEFATLYQDWKKLVHPDDFDRVHQEHQDHFHKNKPFSIEFRMREKSGRWHWIHSRGLLVERDNQGHPLRMVGTHSDIQERKLAEAALRESEAQFRAMFELASIGMAQADPHTGQWLRVNAKMCAMTGYSEKELLGKRVPELTHPEDRQRDWGLFQQVIRGEAPDYRVEKRYVRKDGTTVWVSVNMTVIRDAAGQPLRTMATIEDITERMRVEESHTRLVTAVAAAAETIMITDANAIILYANPAFAKTTGYTCQETIGQNPRLLQSGQHGAEFYRQMWAILKAGQVWQGRFINKRKDGKLFEEEASISPVLGPAGQIVNYVAVKRDITREVQLEEQFRQSQKLEAVGRLAGGVAHDFNNMLAVIQMNASVLEDNTVLTPEQAEGIQDIIKAAQRGAMLTRQLLTFSRRQVTESHALDLNDVVLGVVKMLRQLIGEDVRLLTSLEPSDAPVWGDPGMMEQVLMNLAVNARDALPEGGVITIGLTSLMVEEAAATGRRVQAGDYFRLTVRDNGTGIAPEHLPHIFEPFYTTKDVGLGTGLGLATVHGIVEQHHGWIEVESHLGQGTAFHIHLPRLVETAPVEAPAQAVARPHGGHETILLVEDAEDLRKMATLCLAKYGYKVLPAPSGAAALELWRQHHTEVDLLLTDIIMPDGVSGGQLAAQLREAKPGLKVIYMSGYPGDVAGRGGLDLHEGVNFLQKPFTVAKLTQTMRACLDRG